MLLLTWMAVMCVVEAQLILLPPQQQLQQLGQQQQHLVYLPALQLQLYQPPQLTTATSQTTHQNMIMDPSLRNLYSSTKLKGQDRFQMTIGFLGGRTALWVMRFLAGGMML